MLGSRKPKSNSPRTPRTPSSPKSLVFIDIGSGSLDTSPVSPTRKASPKAARSPARWATAVRQASPQAARRTSPPPPPSYKTTVGDNAPLYSVRSPAAMLAAHAAHAASAATTETEYPSKFLAIYYIDMMLGFIDDFATCCIGMLSGIENVKYIMAQSPIEHGVINKLLKLAEKIKSVRYKYKQGNIETEVKQIELFLREKGLQSYTSETYSYYDELEHIWKSLGRPKKGKEGAINQYAHISTILNNPQYNDEKKLEEIQKYTRMKNKALVVMVNEKTRLNKMSLVSLDEKLKLLTEQIKELESIINQNFWTAAGKRSYNEYLEIVRRRGTQGTLGGKKRSVIAKRGGVGGVGSRFRQFFGMKDKGYQVIPVNEDVSQDYMTVLNIYKDKHIEKVRKLYDTIVFIYNYAEYHRKIASEDALQEYNRDRIEYENVLKHFKGDIAGNYPRDYNEAMIKNLENLRKSPSLFLQGIRPDLTDTAHFVRHILHNFKLLKGRKVELERKITLYYA
jgi:hypothetical protein